MKLEIKNIKINTGDIEVIKDVSLAVESGQVHVLMGPNGSGKSTLLNGIFGHPNNSLTSGSINIDGEDITNLKTEQKAEKGMFLSMQQLPKIEGVSLLQCLHSIVKKEKDISIFDFHKIIKEKAELLGIDYRFLTQNVNSGLSGGEKKQTEILQLFAISPKFAFLDEIDSGVDVQSLKKVFAGIEILRKEGTGFVLVTHNVNILNYIMPDKVSIMKGGEIVQTGSEELIEKINKEGF